MAEYYTHTVRMKNRITKGHYGYIGRQKRRLIIRSLILLAGAAGLVIIGWIVTKTNKNLLSVAGILTAVPMAMQLAQLIAYSRFHSRSKEEYEKVREITGEGVLDTELVIAKRDGKSIPVNYAVFTEERIIVFTGDATLDLKTYTEYLHTFLRLEQIDCEILLYKELEPFLARLKKEEIPSRKEVSENVLKREGVFRAVSM
ncbi:MAG: hypothetical protein IJL98_02975 [Lachnospiraceae bacterium]|nr:hypothetical protein [Lachnospiraceae bacterium]